MEQQHTVQGSMKVYELAKELGMDSLSLLDRLATLNIKVKNHMSDLGQEEIARAKASLQPAEAPTAKKKTATKSVVRKKKTETTEGAAASATKSAPAKTASAQKEALNASTAPSGATAAAPASPIIRRRSGQEGATSEVTTKAKRSDHPLGASIEALEPISETDETRENRTDHTEALGNEPISEFDTATEATTEYAEVPVEAAELASDGEALSALQSHTGTAVPSENPPETSAISSPLSDAKKTVIITQRPQAPRRTFLSVVDPAQASPIKSRIISTPAPANKNEKGGVKGTTTSQDKDGFRIIRMTKENLDQMAEEENAKKKLAGRTEGEIKPEDVRFNDYRKKEVVFLPKRKKIPMGKMLKKTELTTAAAHKRVVEMGANIAVGELASQMSVRAGDVIKKLMTLGTMATVNQSVDFDTATLVAHEFQFEVKNIAFKEDSIIDADLEADENLAPRPPVVTIMGHVDHGKTSLLDAIRSAKVAEGEHGGITQHIGAYSVKQGEHWITFIDTPGHEAFTSMRARGANVTDVVILVVAADDGVMPQTREALSHAKAAGVPIIVAMNKMDKPGATPDRVKQQLSELDLLAEDWGGQTMFIPVSAHKKTGLSELLEAILLQAEVLDLKANPDAQAQGTVLEGRIEKGRGPVASVLVKRGTLKVGDIIVSGQTSGKVKALTNHLGEAIKTCAPGMAAEVLGFTDLPGAGEPFNVVDSDTDAQTLVDNRRLKELQDRQSQQKGVKLEDLFSKIQEGKVKELNVILKADVSGSVEAVKESLLKLSTSQIKVKVIFSAAGGITESDVLLATASGALIIGFNVRPESKARQLAEREHVEIKTYNIIYELIDEVRGSMAGLLDKIKTEKFLGRAEVRQTFSVPKLGTVAGTFVVEGKLVRGSPVRLLRDSRVMFEGKMNSLRRFKDDAKEVLEGFECGVGLENYNDVKVGDIIEAFEIEMVTPELKS